MGAGEWGGQSGGGGRGEAHRGQSKGRGYTGARMGVGELQGPEWRQWVHGGQSGGGDGGLHRGQGRTGEGGGAQGP